MSGSGETFDNTVFAAGHWGSGGADDLGVYTGGSAGTASMTLNGTVAAVGDTLTATGPGGALTLRAYSDIAGGIVFTTPDLSTFYVFLSSGTYVPTQSYTLSYTVAGNSGLACFLAGTRIATARGEVTVERLREGDRVVALRRGRFMRVRWLGRRHVTAAPPALWPVRVAAGAFGDEQPARDLLLSPDHAVFAGGGLIPVRYLVNGATIARTAPPPGGLEYWHVELDAHDLLLAEGLPAESYLETGNRGAFDNAASPIRAHPALARRIWQDQACARLLLEPAAQAPVRERLLARAEALGWSRTAEADLRVLAGGAALEDEREGDVLRVPIPAGACRLRLLSRCMAPADVLSQGGDARSLGVAVTRLSLDGVEIAPHDPRRARGWHDPEPGLHWTDGAAVLALGAPLTAPAMLEIATAPLLRYWLAPGETECRAVQAESTVPEDTSLAA
jgi:hypothetical protein